MGNKANKKLELSTN